MKYVEYTVRRRQSTSLRVFRDTTLINEEAVKSYSRKYFHSELHSSFIVSTAFPQNTINILQQYFQFHVDFNESVSSVHIYLFLIV
jgi:hypothetical protein